jgi:hypothetical protein
MQPIIAWITFLTIAATALPGADFRAGVSRLNITPDSSLWLSGYASRDKPAEGKMTELWAKAIALEDSSRGRLVIITTDLIGLPGSLTDEISVRVAKKHGLDRSRLVFNSSHTHSGPVIRANLTSMYSLTPQQDEAIRNYTRALAGNLFELISKALLDLEPASLRYGESTAAFAINRREPAPGGIKLGVNLDGPVDHSVPVIEVRAGAKLKAVLFGYTCHNTTLGGQYLYSGDYAGFAQAEIEQRHPGASALFILLCGGDQNPNPRGAEAHARQHGASLADAVDRALAGKLDPLRGKFKSAYSTAQLRFGPHTRETFEAEANDSNIYRARRARDLLAAYDARKERRTLAYPVQAVRIGNSITLLALGGEVVIDYQIRAKKEFAGERLIVAGYSNDVMCYIPSQRVLKEGGYEADMSMVYYGMPGPFADDVEEIVFDTIRRAMARVGVKSKN